MIQNFQTQEDLQSLKFWPALKVIGDFTAEVVTTYPTRSSQNKRKKRGKVQQVTTKKHKSTA